MHDKGVVVEAELEDWQELKICQCEPKRCVLTDPEEAQNSLKNRGRLLAIAIGTSHGAYKFKGEPKLDFERLKKLPA